MTQRVFIATIFQAGWIRTHGYILIASQVLPPPFLPLSIIPRETQDFEVYCLK